MKLSKYSFVIKRGSDYVLYNCWTEKMAVLEDRLREWLESGDVDHIQDIHPEFYDYLLREQFIVDNELFPKPKKSSRSGRKKREGKTV